METYYYVLITLQSNEGTTKERMNVKFEEGSIELFRYLRSDMRIKEQEISETAKVKKLLVERKNLPSCWT